MSGEVAVRLMVISFILTPFAVLGLLATCSALTHALQAHHHHGAPMAGSHLITARKP